MGAMTGPKVGFPGASLILPSKQLISLKIFLLNLSSICHAEALARAGGALGCTSAQSYPQLLWVWSYER
ncbi:MAG: hypothetical protein ABI907_00255 [Ramlibacter sp.]